MATAIDIKPSWYEKIENFAEKHVVKIAFAVSVVTLAIFAPLQLLLGSVLGAIIHSYLQLQLVINPHERMITVPVAVVAIIGATAALLGMAPVGECASLAFRVIPLASSLTIGSTAYRIAGNC